MSAGRRPTEPGDSPLTHQQEMQMVKGKCKTESSKFDFSQHLESNDELSQADAVGNTQNILPPVAKIDETDLGYFNDNPDEKTDNNCVIVVHYAFENTEDQRDLDRIDVQKLESCLKGLRKCKFHAEDSPTKEYLLQLLGSDQEMMSKFKLQDGQKASVLMLFILSHGEEDGVILTDHKINGESGKYITFTTMEVLNKMKNLAAFKETVKLVFFLTCRARKNNRSGNPSNPMTGNENSVRISSIPNEYNFVILYACVENTLSYRHWVVDVLCPCLNKLKEDLKLEVFLTMIQDEIHKKTLKSPTGGQTVEVRYFLHKSLTIARSKSDESSFERQSISTSEDCNDFHKERRQALVHWENPLQKEDIKSLLHALEFQTEDMDLSRPPWENTPTVESSAAEKIGCYLFILNSKLTISEDETDQFRQIRVDIGRSNVSLKHILSRYIGPINDKMIGIPKIFAFVDHISMSDAAPVTPSYIGKIHCGFFIIILTGPDADQKLISILRDLKNAGMSLQEAVANALHKYGLQQFTISPQTISMLPFLVHFRSSLFIRLELIPIDSNHQPTGDFTLDIDELACLMTRQDLNRFEEHRGHLDSMANSAIFVISAHTGMGKTTLTKKLVEIITRTSKAKVCHIQLEGEEGKFFVAPPNVEKFLNKFCPSISGGDDAAVICFDGFDRVCYNWRQNVQTLIKKLAGKEKIVTLVTTRPQEYKGIRKSLENHHPVCLTIQSLADNPQWQKDLMSMAAILPVNEVSDFHEKLQKMGAADLMGNPSHLIIVSKAWRNHPKKAEDLYLLYQHVMEEKLKPYLDLKSHDYEELTKNLLPKAATCFLQGGEVSKLPPGIMHMGNLELLNKSSVVTASEDEILFQHKSMAEYLVVENYFQNDEPTFTLGEILKFEHCRKFIDCHLKRGKKLRIELGNEEENVLLIKTCIEESLWSLLKVTYDRLGADTLEHAQTIQVIYDAFVAACKNKEEELSFALFQSMTKMLSTHSSLLTNKNEEGCTPFLLASEIGSRNMLEQVYTADAKVSEERTAEGKTAMHLAVKNNNYGRDVLVFLLEKCPELLRAQQGGTPLEHAIHFEKPNLVQLIISFHESVMAPEQLDIYKKSTSISQFKEQILEQRRKEDYFGHFESRPIAKAENVCVLVVHYGFKGRKWERNRNEGDVRSLRNSLEKKRKCIFRHWESPLREELLQVLGDDGRLRNMFSLGKYSHVSVFMLFILSHGDKNGIIFTDHIKESCDELTTFTTTEILASLKKLHSFMDTLKIINFITSRGKNKDLFTSSKAPLIELREDNSNSVRISSQPNNANFVIINACVESTELVDHWLVGAVCLCYDNLAEDTPFEVFTAMLQHQVHERSMSSATEGQTVEVNIFPHDKLVIAKSKGGCDTIKKQDIAHSYNFGGSFENQPTKAIVFVENREQGRNTMRLLSSLGVNGQCFNSSESGIPLPDQIESSGCLLFIVHSKLSVEESTEFSPIRVRIAFEDVPVGQVLSKFIGTSDQAMIGRPKVFLFVNSCAKSGGIGVPGGVPRICFESAFESFGTYYSGIFAAVFAGNDSERQLELALTKMREGAFLQEAVSDALRKCQKGVEGILSRTFSTMPFLFKFSPACSDLKNRQIDEADAVSWLMPQLSIHEGEKVGGSSLLSQYQGKNEWTPLHVAARFRGLKCLEQLLLVNPDLANVNTKDGQNLLHLAVCNNKDPQEREKIIDYLVQTYPHMIEEKANDGWTPLHFAARIADLNCVKQLLAADAENANVKTNTGQNLLHVAACHDKDPQEREKIIEHLLKHYQHMIKEKDEDGGTPLHYAAHFSDLNCVKQLLAADPEQANSKTNTGQNLMHLAASRDKDPQEREKIIEHLFKHYPHMI